MPNSSPRLGQLKNHRHPCLQENGKTDVVIVGAGIAGVVTAYYVLKETHNNVVILEGAKIAHGATGHNAGQVTAYFERPFDTIVSEFGIEMATQAQQDIFNAREKLEEIIMFANLKVPLHTFIGYAGCTTHDQLLEHLERMYLRTQAGFQMEAVLVSEEYLKNNSLPSQYVDLIQPTTREHIQSVLDAASPDFIAALAMRKGCLNSALFVEELIDFLQKTYQERIHIYEYTLVQRIVLERDHVVCETITQEPEKKIHSTLACAHVVLCTNGFEQLHIQNNYGKQIDSKFHNTIQGTIGYMSGYLDHCDQDPTAISYFLPPGNLKSSDDIEAYYYLTRRPFETDEGKHTLTCVGGPEKALEKEYSRTENQPDVFHKQIDEFVHATYRYAPPGDIKYHYRWHGLLGYTKNNLRLIGPDPYHARLLYNLGCNGIGILPSVHGGWKITQFLLNKVHTQSIFDPL